jgi:hypothetical protein
VIFAARLRRRAAWVAALFALLLVARLLLPAVSGGAAAAEWSTGAKVQPWDVAALCLSGGKPAPDGHLQPHCPLCSPPDALPLPVAAAAVGPAALLGTRAWVPASSPRATHTRAERHAVRAPPVLA